MENNVENVHKKVSTKNFYKTCPNQCPQKVSTKIVKKKVFRDLEKTCSPIAKQHTHYKQMDIATLRLNRLVTGNTYKEHTAPNKSIQNLNRVALLKTDPPIANLTTDTETHPQCLPTTGVAGTVL